MDWRLEDICVYCESLADTQDHVPSKSFLDKPYPDDLRTVKCCRECNHKFSLDEEYVSCIIDCMKDKTTNPNSIKREKTKQTLLHSNKLLHRIKNQSRMFADLEVWDLEKKRFELVFYKLAYGHLAYENSSLKWDSVHETNIWLLENMPKTLLEEFNKPYRGDIVPEIGSNCFVKNGGFHIHVGLFESSCYSDWIIVQEGRYRYCVSPDNTKVKFVIAEYLAVEVSITK